MTWTLHEWIFQLESPLYIGSHPAGALNRCRLYVPARALWGAVTAELARQQETFPDYPKQGKDVQEKMRFTYLYPAEKINEKYMAWLPIYQEGQGLCWQRQDTPLDKPGQPDRRFRRRLLDTRPATAIHPETDSAQDESLRETECIQTHWRDSQEPGFSPVYLKGYVFSRDAGLLTTMDNLETLFLGGDTRYGLGRLRRVVFEPDDPPHKAFGASVKLEGGDPMIRCNRILNHACIGKGLSMIGGLERLSGWDYGLLMKEGQDSVCWVPGSCPKEEGSLVWQLAPDGIIRPQSDLQAS